MAHERRYRLARSIGLWSVVALAAVAAASCIRTTPFESDPSVTDLTAKNLHKLDARRPGPRPFKIAAFGDTQTDYDHLHRTIDAINARDDIEFVLIAGDLTTFGLLEEYEWSSDEYRRLKVPFLTAIGNHDTLGRGVEIYRQMYGPLDYSFSFGDTKFILFNSSTLEFNGAAPDRDWLTSEVENHAPGEKVVLVAHHDLSNFAADDLPGGDVEAFYDQLVQRDSVIGVIHGHLADFDLELWHGRPILQCGTYERTFEHTIVTIDGAHLSFERCQFENCTPVVPVEKEQEEQ